MFGVRVFGSDPALPFFPLARASAALDVVLGVDELGEAEAVREFLTGVAFGASVLAGALEAAVLEFPEVVLDAVFLLAVVFDALLPFFSAITPLP